MEVKSSVQNKMGVGHMAMFLFMIREIEIKNREISDGSKIKKLIQLCHMPLSDFIDRAKKIFYSGVICVGF